MPNSFLALFILAAIGLPAVAYRTGRGTTDKNNELQQTVEFVLWGAIGGAIGVLLVLIGVLVLGQESTLALVLPHLHENLGTKVIFGAVLLVTSAIAGLFVGLGMKGLDKVLSSAKKDDVSVS